MIRTAGNDTLTLEEMEEKWCRRRMLKITGIDHIINEEVFQRAGEKNTFLKILKKTSEYVWTGHIFGHNCYWQELSRGQWKVKTREENHHLGIELKNWRGWRRIDKMGRFCKPAQSLLTEEEELYQGRGKIIYHTFRLEMKTITQNWSWKLQN